ncbi:MAG: hypothetical protein ACYDAY_09170 [Candidatus Dormibacteria bacterium]
MSRSEIRSGRGVARRFWVLSAGALLAASVAGAAALVQTGPVARASGGPTCPQDNVDLGCLNVFHQGTPDTPVAGEIAAREWDFVVQTQGWSSPSRVSFTFSTWKQPSDHLHVVSMPVYAGLMVPYFTGGDPVSGATGVPLPCNEQESPVNNYVNYASAVADPYGQTFSVSMPPTPGGVIRFCFPNGTPGLGFPLTPDTYAVTYSDPTGSVTDQYSVQNPVPLPTGQVGSQMQLFCKLASNCAQGHDISDPGLGGAPALEQGAQYSLLLKGQPCQTYFVGATTRYLIEGNPNFDQVCTSVPSAIACFASQMTVCTDSNGAGYATLTPQSGARQVGNLNAVAEGNAGASSAADTPSQMTVIAEPNVAPSPTPIPSPSTPPPPPPPSPLPPTTSTVTQFNGSYFSCGSTYSPVLGGSYCGGSAPGPLRPEAQASAGADGSGSFSFNATTDGGTPADSAYAYASASELAAFDIPPGVNHITVTASFAMQLNFTGSYGTDYAEAQGLFYVSVYSAPCSDGTYLQLFQKQAIFGQGDETPTYSAACGAGGVTTSDTTGHWLVSGGGDAQSSTLERMVATGAGQLRWVVVQLNP